MRCINRWVLCVLQLIAWDAKCDRYDLEIEILNNLPEFQAVYLENEELFDYVATHAGYKISPTNVWKAVHDLCSLYDDLFIEVKFAAHYVD